METLVKDKYRKVFFLNDMHNIITKQTKWKWIKVDPGQKHPVQPKSMANKERIKNNQLPTLKLYAETAS